MHIQKRAYMPETQHVLNAIQGIPTEPGLMAKLREHSQGDSVTFALPSMLASNGISNPKSDNRQISQRQIATTSTNSMGG